MHVQITNRVQITKIIALYTIQLFIRKIVILYDYGCKSYLKLNKINSAMPRAITHPSKKCGLCNYFPNCTRIHAITINNSCHVFYSGWFKMMLALQTEQIASKKY